MLKSIKINLEIIESLLFFWQAGSEGEKVGENYIISISEFTEMKYLYDNEFTKESVRKVLSAISNKELLNNANKKEMKYWNNNMWMMEDLEFTNMMIQPVKTLHSDKFLEKLENNPNKDKYENIEIVFLPGHVDEYYIDENKLIINFFRIMVDLFNDNNITIAGKTIDEYIEEKLNELLNK